MVAGTGVVIPAFHEERMVGSVVRAVRQLGYSVIVVDDASTDATAAEAEIAGATVLTMPMRAGAWGAIQAGMRHALRLGWQRIITMDADGQHLPSSLTALIAAATHADVVIGSCPGRASRLRLWAWALFRALSGLQVTDITSGLRLYNRRAASMALRDKGILADYQDVDILLLLRNGGLHIVEVPVLMLPRTDGKSRIFCTWGRVALYMACTCLLALAGRGRACSPAGMAPCAGGRKSTRPRERASGSAA